MLALLSVMSDTRTMTPETRSLIARRAANGDAAARFVDSVLRRREAGITREPTLAEIAARMARPAPVLVTHPSGVTHVTTLPSGRPFTCRECQP